MKKTSSHLVLAGDIGGTKTNLGLFRQGRGRPVAERVHSYPSRDFRDLETIVLRFLAETGARPRAACFGVAGPVADGECVATNLPWHITIAGLLQRTPLKRVVMVNDVEAVALALPVLKGRELCALNSPPVRPRHNMVVVAPGTGLGLAMLIWDGERYTSVASEGGHADFAPVSEAEVSLWQYLRKRHTRVSEERVLSGPGQVNIFDWLCATGSRKPGAWVQKAMREMAPARAITMGALEKKDPVCMAAVQHFVAVFGSIAGNLALTATATGGVFLGGGIPPKILQALKDGPFMPAFSSKGRLSPYVANIAVRVILNDKAALLGSANRALSL